MNLLFYYMKTHYFNLVLDLKKAGEDSFDALQESIDNEGTANIFINLHYKGFLTLTNAELKECYKQFYGEQAENCFKSIVHCLNKDLNDFKKTKPEFKVMQSFIAEFEYAREWIGECGGWIAFYKEDQAEMRKGIIKHCFLNGRFMYDGDLEDGVEEFVKCYPRYESIKSTIEWLFDFFSK